MVPYYERDGITIYCGDCRAILPALDRASVDLCLTDPTYGETALAWDQLIHEWPALVAPLLKPSASLWCFGSLKSILQTIGDFGAYRLAQDIVWEKHNGSGFQDDRFKRVHEIAVQFYRKVDQWGAVYKDPQYTQDATARKVLRRGGGPPHLGKAKEQLFIAETGGPRLMRSVIYAQSCHGYAVNETQKPEEIVAPLLRYSCPPGGLVLDCFMGSGTTLAVSRNTGRRAIGIELREEQCEAAVRRLSQAVLPLGAA